MAAVNILLPKEYGYVIMTVAGTCFIGLWHAYRVPSFRKPAGMKYPKAYADSGDMANAKSPEMAQALYLFNCAQRAHGNWMESFAPVVTCLLISGLQYPLTATGMGVAWSLFRVMYAIGYTRPDQKDGKGRIIGTPASFVALGLFGLTAWTGFKMVS